MLGTRELTDPQTLAVISGDTRCGIDWHYLARGVGGLRGFREDQRRRPSRGATTAPENGPPLRVRLRRHQRETTAPALNATRSRPEEVGETRFSVPCFLVAHPKGTLMWDLGILPDDTVEARARGEQGNPTATSAR